MSSKFVILLVAGVTALCAQEAPLEKSVKINLPADSPLTLISTDLGESHVSQRGSAVVLDLDVSLTLHNSSSNRVRGVTLLVAAQEVTPGGKASVSVPSLDVAPNQNFPVRINLRLLRPAQMGGGPLVQVNLDGVLFQDFSFYGPNRLDSRRTMMAWEMQAQRDRKYFKSVLAAHGIEGLKQAMLESLNRQAERPRLDVQVSRGRAVTSAAVGEHNARFAFLRFPGEPVEPIDGWAEIAGNEARNPRIDVRNLSSRQVRSVEIGWIVTDREGKQYIAGSVPASGPQFNLKAGSTSRVLQDTALRLSKEGGTPLSITGMRGFVGQVEFADGTVWIPNRESLANAQLLDILAPSPEEQRLMDLYRKKGPKALADELNKF
ncbi:MAG TPA: hypothetical protein VMG35_03455 [Bryobacteraceae bacterium]|nr:hypothetical protein [Bryobacteraceae bacterium]